MVPTSPYQRRGRHRSGCGRYREEGRHRALRISAVCRCGHGDQRGSSLARPSRRCASMPMVTEPLISTRRASISLASPRAHIPMCRSWCMHRPAHLLSGPPGHPVDVRRFSSSLRPALAAYLASRTPPLTDPVNGRKSIGSLTRAPPFFREHSIAA